MTFRNAVVLAGFFIGLVTLPLATAGAQEPPTVPTTAAPTTAAPPPTTAAPTTAPPTTESAPAPTAAPETTAPRPTTTAKPKASTTTIPVTTTTPEQLPTLPPLPEGQVPAPTDTTIAVEPGGGTATVSPRFPALSVGGFTVALLVLVVSFLLNSRRMA